MDFSLAPATTTGRLGLSRVNLAILFGAKRIVLVGFDMRR
jgi:hypothetical protein